ncbi:MAG: putative toxin-antitoxin system toxin component, PIN family [Clostridia bacterium]|nr:putative toxin-antitoxin system toxin component, PIN family [Clostridia bacterium]
MNTYYAVIDTNVIISSAMSANSFPRQVYDAIKDGIIVPLLSDEIFVEYNNVIKRSKFHFPNDVVNDILNLFITHGIFMDGTHPLDAIIPDLKDVIFYEVVLEARDKTDAYLVTGNSRHFPKQTFIVTPRQMINIINGLAPDQLDIVSKNNNESA